MRILLLLLTGLFGFVSESHAVGQWEQKASFGGWGRHRAVAVGIGNKVYAGMGHLNGDGSDEWYPEWWEFDPASNCWTQKADYIGNNGNGDQDLTAIAIDGIGYVGLGQFSDETHFKYNPMTNTWTQIADAPSASFTNTDPFVLNGKGYFPSFFTAIDSLYEFDPVLDTWTAVAEMPVSVGHRDATFTIDSKGYFKKGTQFFEFDPATNLWTPKAPFPGIAPNNNIGLSQMGYGFLIGGYLGWGDMYQEVWRYDPTLDTWEQLPDYPFAKRRWAVKAKVGERCYVGLGTSGTNYNDFWEFDQFTGLDDFDVEKFQAFPTLANDHVSFVSENKNEFEILIFNSLGKRINSITSENGSVRLNRNGLSSGVYLYQVIQNDKVLHSDRFVFN
ncbi:MAG: T9SS type A sorting domain-containing protein [Crocinitomicaceae bacterium]|nr:T9SS type A sorting domain-containing protein [Crocinitomicaceae bacterium]MDG2153626.1 T9SS type A sorting domain-containing protein [Crocinitomicaceae bacterium]